MFHRELNYIFKGAHNQRVSCGSVVFGRHIHQKRDCSAVDALNRQSTYIPKFGHIKSMLDGKMYTLHKA